MLKHTFIHIPGIGNKIEKKLWYEGITDWYKCIENIKSIPSNLYLKFEEYIPKSIEAFKNQDVEFFSNNLPSSANWRLIGDFFSHAAFIDIETTSGPFNKCIITTIALANNNSVKWYVNGRNLWEFVTDINKYKLIITYNGSYFDMPIIQRYFGIKLNKPHIDLRFVLASCGIKGGLKKCEKIIGINREGLEGVDGWSAVLLWKMAEEGDQKALETLLAYNIADAVNLCPLAIYAYNLKLSCLGIDIPKIRYNCLSRELPLKPDPVCIAKVNKMKQSYLFNL